MEAALRYADDGWQVFPLHGIENGKCTCGLKCSSPGKHPRVEWSKAATDDFGVITEWWKKWPNSNIGVATGKRSGIYVIDVDNKGSVDLGGGTLIGSGDHSLRQKQTEIGKLPDTRSSTTGSGGTHLIFQYPEDPSDTTSLGNRGGLLPSVDTRGDGGYIVAPPSLHVSGNRYRWNDPDQPITPPSEAWLTFIATATGGDLSPLNPTEDFVLHAGEGRHEWLFRAGAKLRGVNGLDKVPLYGALMAMNNQHCRPPVTPKDIEHIVDNCMKYEANVVMQLDTSDAPTLLEGDDLAVLLFDFLMEEPEAFKPLVHKLLHGGEAMILGGPPNVGKTWATMDMMLGIATGGYFANHFSCHQAPVLFIDEEGSRRGDWERFQMLLAGRDDLSASGIPLFAKIDAGVRLDTDKGHAQLARLIERYRPGAIFLDSLVRVHGGNESDNRAMANFFGVIKKLQTTYGCAVVFTHHIRKPSKDSQEDPMWMLRGASDIQGYPDSILIFLPGADSSQVKVVHTKMRNSEKLRSFGLYLKIEDEQKQASIAYFEEDEGGPENSSRQSILNALRSRSGEQMQAEEIAAVVGLAVRTVIEHLQVLAAAGQVRSQRDMENKWWHQAT
jgi:hypothetical protein